MICGPTYIAYVNVNYPELLESGVIRCPRRTGTDWSANEGRRMELSNRNGPAGAGRELEFANDNDYMRIGEVAEKFGVTLRALRFYEDRGLLTPRRDGAVRLYARRDVARLKFVLLGRRVGLSLREVKQLIDMYDPDGPNTRQLRFALEKGDRQLRRLTRQRDEIVGTIAELEELLAGIRQRLAAVAGARSSA